MGYTDKDATEEARVQIENVAEEDYATNLTEEEARELLEKNESFRDYILKEMTRAINWKVVAKQTREEGVYFKSEITEFVNRQRNLEEEWYPAEVPGVTLVYWFTDGETRPHPALAFEDEDREKELYKLAYVDPSIEKLWKEAQGE